MSNEYWSTTPLCIRVQAEDGNVSEIPLEQPFALFGSADGSDVCLPRIARRAILFVRTSRGIRGVVLSGKSKNAGRSLRVELDEPISMGPYQVTFLQTDAPNCESHAASSSQPAIHGVNADESLYAVTWMMGGVRRYCQIQDERPVLVGRKEPCGIVLPDDRLSGQHCCLFRTQNRLWVLDLNSGNGTVVARRKIQCAAVELGKSLVVGKQRVHFLSLHTQEQIQQLASKSTDELDDLRQKLCQTEQESISSADRLAESEAAQRGLESQLEHSVSRLKVCELDVEQKEAELKRCREQLKTQEEAALAAEREHSSLRAEIAALNADHAESRKAMEASQVALDKALADAEAERQAMAEELASLKRQNSELQKLVEETQDQLADANSKLTNDAIADRESELRVLQEELATEREILQRLQLQVQAADGDGSAINEDETCISSLAFQDILEDAMNGLPSIDDETA